MLDEGDHSTALETLLRARRSVRGFRPDPVPRAVIERALTLAQRAPSNCNVQPWIVHVVSGEAAERMRAALYAHAVAGEPPSPDYVTVNSYADVHRARQVEAAKALFAATGIGRGDSTARTRSTLRNFRFFEAPHAAFLFMPAWAGVREASDCGMYAQSLLLALTAAGVASCPQAALSYPAALVRRELGVGDELKLLFGIAFGYVDDAHPANAVRTDRALLADTVVFHGDAVTTR